jgi:hypothetical protein
LSLGSHSVPLLFLCRHLSFLLLDMERHRVNELSDRKFSALSLSPTRGPAYFCRFSSP